MLANPPYSIKTWNREAFAHDRWGRNMFGTPPQGRADYAFIQHIIASMNEKNGRCAVLLPHGILFRNEETDVRRRLILSDTIEAVIGLGPNLFYNAPMEACVLICNNHKADSLRHKIIFINAVKDVTRKNAESLLEEKHIRKIVSAYHSSGDIDSFKRTVSLEEIENNKFDLSIQKYVFINELASDNLSLRDAIAEWSFSHSVVMDSYATLTNLM